MADIFKNPLAVEADAPDISNLGDLAGDMVYRLSGCDDLTIRKELQRIWMDFATRTGILNFKSKIQIFEGVDEYAVPLPLDVAITKVSNLRFGVENNAISCASVKWPIHRSNWTFLRKNGVPTIRFERKFINAEKLKRWNVVYLDIDSVPRNGSEDIPSWIFDRYSRALTEGAMAGLLNLTGRPWSDPAAAKMSAITYENAINEAAGERFAGRDGQLDVTNYEGWA